MKIFYSKDKFIKILKTFSKIKLAYLIGTGALNRLREDSDIDVVLVATDIENLSYQDIYSKIDKIIKSNNLDLKIIIPKETDPLFLFQIAKNGILLYRKSELEQMQFEMYSLKMYYDTQAIRNIYNFYLDKRFKSKTYAQ